MSMPIKVELHSHTSDDPIDRIPHSAAQLIDRAVELGYAALAITLHGRQLSLDRFAPYASERGIVLIPGVEVSIGGRHVLLINFPAGADKVRTFEDVARLKRREARGLIVAPHPFFPAPSCLRGLMDVHADLFDAVEYNAMYAAGLNFNRRAVRWAARHDKPLVGNCDVHRLHQLGTTCSLVDAEPDGDAICDAIRSGRVRIASHPLSWPTAVRTFVELTMDEWR
ncbi:MAG TPA: PHP-associated domain-containing protein [Vicinamibacterales bacterium]|nr:PHP-associated domain-containing protein [Vicinamibacterales bacterium]